MTYQDVEKARKAYLKNIILGLLLMQFFLSIVYIPTLIFNKSNQSVSDSFSFVFTVLAFFSIVSIFICNKARRAYHKAYKDYFVQQSLYKIFTDLIYIHETGVPSYVLYHTGVINTGDRYTANDFAQGKYKDVDFAQSDVHIELKHRISKNSNTYTTIFRGRFMVFEFPKQFTYKLSLVGKGFKASKKPRKSKTTGRKIESVSTESEEFNRLFKIYAEDGFEAFYILDPALIARIEDIAVHYKNKIIFCFVNNRLIIGINDGKDSFEAPHPFKSLDEAKENAKVLSEIKLITDFVDQLSLSNKLFK